MKSGLLSVVDLIPPPSFGSIIISSIVREGSETETFTCPLQTGLVHRFTNSVMYFYAACFSTLADDCFILFSRILRSFRVNFHSNGLDRSSCSKPPVFYKKSQGHK